MQLRFLAATCLALGLPVSMAQASTVERYNAPCKYIDASSKLQIDARCSIAYGSQLPSLVFYELSFPHGGKVLIHMKPNGSTANGIPSQAIATDRQIVVLTSESEVFVFQAP